MNTRKVYRMVGLAVVALCRYPHYSSKDLAALLHMSSRTVDSHIHR